MSNKVQTSNDAKPPVVLYNLLIFFFYSMTSLMLFHFNKQLQGMVAGVLFYGYPIQIGINFLLMFYLFLAKPQRYKAYIYRCWISCCWLLVVGFSTCSAGIMFAGVWSL